MPGRLGHVKLEGTMESQLAPKDKAWIGNQCRKVIFGEGYREIRRSTAVPGSWRVLFWLAGLFRRAKDVPASFTVYFLIGRGEVGFSLD
jgi:hypothetical protein